MAKLCEEKKIVRALDDFYKNVSYTHPSTRGVRLNNLSRDAIPEEDFSAYLSTTLTSKDRCVHFLCPKYFKSENYIFNRANKFNRLFKACIDHGFIERVYLDVPTIDGKLVPVLQGVRVTTKGTDLLHFWGYVEELFKKYPTQKIIFTTICSTTLLIFIMKAILYRLWGVQI